MKKNAIKTLNVSICLLILVLSLVGLSDAHTVSAQATRPLLTIPEYSITPNPVDPWVPFEINYRINNDGTKAKNILITFTSEDVNPLNGAVDSLIDLDYGSSWIKHSFKINDMSTWKYTGLITATVTYNGEDPAETPYTEVFTIVVPIQQKPSGPAATPTPMPSAQKPLMVIKSYLTDLDPLQPGSNFNLRLFVTNVGNEDAKAVSLMYGGGTSSAGSLPDLNSTPMPGSSGAAGMTGGVSASGGELSNFAPLGQSNIQVIGDVAIGEQKETVQPFIVNVTTQPGAYPLKVSFSYTDARGIRYVDDQVITLLVLALPRLEVSLYRQPLMLNVGMPGALPLQITNISKKTVVLGNLTVTSPNGVMENNTGMIGSLDPGGYYTLDAMFTPDKEGKVPVRFEIRYTDDFNQLRTYNAELEVEVQPAASAVDPAAMPLLDEKGNPILDENGNPVMATPAAGEVYPGGNDAGMGQQEQGFFARVWNAIKGFFGVRTEAPANGGGTMPQPGGEGSGMLPPSGMNGNSGKAVPVL